MPECDWCGECDWCRMLHYPWPCDRREAHGPHTERWAEPVHGCDGSEDDCQRTCPVPEERVLDCLGVKAHPLTMIGRAS